MKEELPKQENPLDVAKKRVDMLKNLLDTIGVNVQVGQNGKVEIDASIFDAFVGLSNQHIKYIKDSLDKMEK